MGRPAIPLDWDKADQLMLAGCTGIEIASALGINEETFYQRCQDQYGMPFTVYAAKKKAMGASILRFHQYQKALGITKKGDNTLLIWLGKQRLGQKENVNDIIVNDDVVKAFEKLMGQIDKAQGESSFLGKEKVAEESPKEPEASKVATMSSVTSCCKESPFM